MGIISITYMGIVNFFLCVALSVITTAAVGLGVARLLLSVLVAVEEL